MQNFIQVLPLLRLQCGIFYKARTVLVQDGEGSKAENNRLELPINWNVAIEQYALYSKQIEIL